MFGYHREIIYRNDRTGNSENARWLFWTAYIFEKHISLLFGRPRVYWTSISTRDIRLFRLILLFGLGMNRSLWGLSWPIFRARFKADFTAALRTAYSERAQHVQQLTELQQVLALHYVLRLHWNVHGSWFCDRLIQTRWTIVKDSTLLEIAGTSCTTRLSHHSCELPLHLKRKKQRSARNVFRLRA